MSNKFNEILEFIKNYSKGRNYKVFLVFVMISTFFWILIKFSKQYTTLVTFPVNYTSIPNNVVWGEIKDNSIDISTTASGFQHLGYAFESKKINLDMSKLRRQANDQFYILPEEQISSIIHQFPSNLELVYRSPDTLFFDLSKKIEKRIPVILKDSLLLSSSFEFVEDVKISPDSVSIAGPASLVSKINYIETEFYFRENIRKNTAETVKLKRIDSDKIEISNKKVKVSINVEQFTQNKLIVPIVLKNVPSGYMLKIFPDDVEVTFNTSLSNFKSITKSSFLVTVDYNKISSGDIQFIPIDIRLLSDKVKLIKTSPSEVEFLLRKIE